VASLQDCSSTHRHHRHHLLHQFQHCLDFLHQQFLGFLQFLYHLDLEQSLLEVVLVWSKFQGH
jgi:hypothetical protein